jgi:ketosteroid isomerase-like protein
VAPENVDRVRYIRELVEAFQRRDYAPTLAALDPEVELDATRIADMLPDVAGMYHGIEGVQSFWRRWLAPWSDLEWDAEEVRAAGDDVVLVVANQRQFGRHSGIETRVPTYAWRYTFRGDRIVRITWHRSPADAFAAAGVTD